jgi:hypothetical protein
MPDAIDWGSVEGQLKQKAGQWYDPTMLADVQRNSSYGAGGGASNVDDWVSRVANKARLRGSNETNSTYEANGRGGVTVGPTGRVNDPNGTGDGGSVVNGGGSFDGSQYTNDLVKQMMDRQAAQDAQNRERGDNLFKMYTDRANQGLAINRNDPIIRAQADAFSANQDRAARNANSDAAERGGQFANLEGVRRMNAEHAGQASGAFEANLMGQELTARRNEIAQALAGEAGLLTADQQNQLQRQLALLDQSIKQQQIGLGQQGVNLQSKSLGQDWKKALLENEQNNNRLGFNYADLYSRNYNNNAQY